MSERIQSPAEVSEALGDHPVSEIFEFREFREDAFRSMEVQICSKTQTVQFACEDHGGDHPTAPAVAISWDAAQDLARWVLTTTRAREHHYDAMMRALAEAIAVIEDCVGYQHSGDPWEENAFDMGELDIHDYARDGRLEAARTALAGAK